MDNRVLMSLLLLAATVISLSHAADPYNAADYDHTGMPTTVSKTANDKGFFSIVSFGKKTVMGVYRVWRLN